VNRFFENFDYYCVKAFCKSIYFDLSNAICVPVSIPSLNNFKQKEMIRKTKDI
jgi:hypothetical protein